MKSFLLVLVICICANGFIIKVPTSPTSGKGIARLEWILRQKQILALFDNICEDSNDSNIIKYAYKFSTEFTVEDYKDAEVVNKFKSLKDKGFLLKGGIFTEFNKDHYDEFVVIRDFLFSAKDFETFFAAASWARQNLNCGLYMNVLYSALIYRTDTNKLYIPPPYEILPNYFFKKDAILTGSLLLSGEDVESEDMHVDGNSYIINVNYTSDVNDENNKMAYFHEDVGINTLVFLKKLIIDASRTDNVFEQPNVAEKIFHLMKQLSTRYDLERYSHGMFDDINIEWGDNITDFYDPMLIYSNGKDFSHRTKPMDLSALDCQVLLKNFETNLKALVSNMIQNDYTKQDILQSLIQNFVTNDDSYESLVFKNIGKDIGMMDSTPSSLEHYMTLARDPLFWKVNNKIVSLIETSLNILPTYTRSELYFPGVEINNADIKKVVTSFEDFVMDTTSSLKPSYSNASFQVKISQPRLSHKPFSVKLNISSLVAQKGLVKIFLGPKMMPGELARRKHQFMVLDAFEIALKKGANSVTRTSSEMKTFTEDFLSIKDLNKYVEDAEFGLDTLSFETERRFTGFPSRLALPKGSEEGLPFQLFVFVAPLSKVIVLDTFSKRVEYNTAATSPGYPLDRFVEDEKIFDFPNAITREIIIVHKKTGSGKSNDFYKPYNKPSYYGEYQVPSNKNIDDDVDVVDKMPYSYNYDLPKYTENINPNMVKPHILKSKDLNAEGLPKNDSTAIKNLRTLQKTSKASPKSLDDSVIGMAKYKKKQTNDSFKENDENEMSINKNGFSFSKSNISAENNTFENKIKIKTLDKDLDLSKKLNSSNVLIDHPSDLIEVSEENNDDIHKNLPPKYTENKEENSAVSQSLINKEIKENTNTDDPSEYNMEEINKLRTLQKKSILDPMTPVDSKIGIRKNKIVNNAMVHNEKEISIDKNGFSFSKSNTSADDNEIKIKTLDKDLDIQKQINSTNVWIDKYHSTEPIDVLEEKANDINKQMSLNIDNFGTSNLSIEKNSNVSIAKDDGSVIEIHSIWGKPSIVHLAPITSKKPSNLGNEIITSKSDRMEFSDTEIFE